MTYIEQQNAHTDSVLRASPYWEATNRDLSFLLGIDYVGGPVVDNTGRIYFTMRITGESAALFYLDEPMGWPRQLTPNNWAAMGLTLGGYRVHPSGDVLLLQVMKHGNENYDIYLFERDGAFRPLLEDPDAQYANIIFKNAGEFFLIADKDDRRTVLHYDIVSGKLDSLYTEDEYVSLLDYKDELLLCVRHFSFSETQLFLLDTRTRKSRDLTERGLFLGGDFTLDGRVITLTSNLSSDQEFMKFAAVDLKAPKKLQLIMDPKVETEEYVFLDKLGITVAGLNRDGYAQLIAFDLKGKPVAVPATEVGVSGGLAANESGQIAFGFSSPRIAPALFTFSLGDNRLSRVAEVSTFGFDFSGINVEVIRYPSSDGYPIPALLYKPADAKRDESNPCMILYHGGPPEQSRPYFQRNMAFALSRGMMVLFPNVRGSTGYGPAYQEMDDLEGREQSLVDCERALDYMVDEGWSAFDKIAIWGGSYGGYVVNYLSVKAPEKFACGLSEAGVSDLDHTIQYSSASFQRGYEREFGPIGSALTRKLSPIFFSEQARRPLLITAGFHDRRVPASDPRRFGWVLKTLGKDVLYYEEVEMGHGETRKSQLIRDYTYSYVFIQEHILRSNEE
jgi:dipeptidyl aminopeptidase/acylaminoacyl peptidase